MSIGTFGIKPIHGNIEADRLAKEAQIQAAVLVTSNNICIIRDKIDLSSLSLNQFHVMARSSDDFSLSDAIRNISRDVP